MSTRERYTSEDDERAASKRLALLAAIFEPSSARLLRLAASLSPRHAVDLGCGRGFSTRLLHAVVGPQRTVGIDSSPEHVARARDVAPPGVEYLVHDVTIAPCPVRASTPEEPSRDARGSVPAAVAAPTRPDLLYCRFLLSQLGSPEETIEIWADGCAPNATLIVEDIADLTSDFPALRRYYEWAAELRRPDERTGRGGHLLRGDERSSAWRTEHSVLRSLALPARQMARLHLLDMSRWSDDPYARSAFDGGELARLGGELAEVARGAIDAGPLRCRIQQTVLSRR